MKLSVQCVLEMTELFKYMYVYMCQDFAVTFVRDKFVSLQPDLN